MTNVRTMCHDHGPGGGIDTGVAFRGPIPRQMSFVVTPQGDRLRCTLVMPHARVRAGLGLRPWPLGLGHSLVIGHWSLVILWPLLIQFSPRTARTREESLL